MTAAAFPLQVVEARRMLHAEGSSVPIHNIVFMGMGEPFHNYEAVTAAVQVMTEPEGLQLSKWVHVCLPAACCLLPAACCLAACWLLHVSWLVTPATSATPLHLLM
jgi:hypothetical protein